MSRIFPLASTALLISQAALVSATDLTIHLKGPQSISRKRVLYQCDDRGVGMGLPTSPFWVEYINAGNNSLAVLPIGQSSQIFVQVPSASGVRYASGQLIWWDARNTTLTSEALSGTKQSSCKTID